jgi:hypothetical protein
VHKVVLADGLAEQPARVPGDWDSVYPVKVEGAVHERVAPVPLAVVAVKFVGAPIVAAVMDAVWAEGWLEKRAKATPGIPTTAASASRSPAGRIRPGNRLALR